MSKIAHRHLRSRLPGSATRLAARPRSVHEIEGTVGLQPLALAGATPFSGARDGLLYVPQSYHLGEALPLMVCLHGAGGNSQHGIAPLLSLADQYKTVLLAPDSRDERSWDVIIGAFGPDVEFLDEALEYVFERYSIDRRRLMLAGFSDGASYALSLGLANGDLFSNVIGFSPGFLSPPDVAGIPRIYVSHGLWDSVLPIQSSSRPLVHRLRQSGYDVYYREFAGGHSVPLEIAREAMGWAFDPEMRMPPEPHPTLRRY